MQIRNDVMGIVIWKRFRFEAAHRLPKTQPKHKCHNLHGHNFVVVLAFKGQVDADGWLIDFAEITAAWEPLKTLVDHRYLNDVSGLENPTSEVLAAWIWARMIEKIPFLVSVEVKENDDCGAIYSGE